MKKQFYILVPSQFQAEEKEEVMMSFIDPNADDRQTVYLTKESAEEERSELNKMKSSFGPYDVKTVTIEIED